MRRLLVWMLSVTLLLGLLTGCSFQKEEPTEVTYTPEQIEALESLGLMYDKARPSHKIGTSYTLRKDAAVVVFLADDNESQWDDASAEAFIQMADAAWADGLSLRCVSGYRSYKTQASTYRGNLAQASQRWVDTYSARPGHSEHQAGLAVDINVARTSAHFESTAEFAWLQANCARFGFILRYPEGADAITGYRFEPWHYRYVGVETAQTCTQQGITYEEYTASLPAAGQASQSVPSVFSGPAEVCFPAFTPPLLPIF